MLTTEQATKLVEDFVTVIERAIVTPNSAPLTIEQAKEQMVAALTGSSRIDRRAVDPDTDTQLVEVIKPDEAEREKLLVEGKLLLLDELTVRHRKLHEVLVHYVGCTPGKLHVRSRDLLFMVVDIGLLMRVAAGPWLDVVDQIEVDERERQAQIKFAARSTENLAPEILKAKAEAKEKAAAATEGQPDGSNG